MRTASTSKAARHSPRGIAVALLLIVSLVAATPVAAAPSASGQERRGDHDLEPDRGHHLDEYRPAAAGPAASPTHFIYFAFMHLAMHNAVNGITGKYELYQWDEHANQSASPEAAAAAAAHRILSNYFPAQIGDAQRAACRVTGARSRTTSGRSGASRSAWPRPTTSSRSARTTAGTRWWPSHRLGGRRLGAHAAWVPAASRDGVDRRRQAAGPRLLRHLRSGRRRPRSTPRRMSRSTTRSSHVGKSDSTVRTPEQTQTARFFSDAGIVPDAGGPAEAGHRSSARHLRQRAAVRRARDEHRRHRRHGLERQAPVHVVAAGDGDPEGRHRRQRRHRG